jgi:hypothetical protein
MVHNRSKNDSLTFIERHGLEEKCLKWVSQKETANFTGYVHDLMKVVCPEMSSLQKYTVDRQFNQLVDLGMKDGTMKNVWCALDTSGSMMSPVVGNVSAFDICISLGIYFSTMNQGAFKNHIIMFDDISKVKQLHGDSFCDKVLQITSNEIAWGSTNFQSVIDEIIRVRTKNPLIPIMDYPQTLLVISDMQFNPVGDNTLTNYEVSMKKLRQVGLDSINIIWWFVNGYEKDFPSQFNDNGVTLIGGFDGSIITTLIKREKGITQSQKEKSRSNVKALTAYEQMIKVLSQEVFNLSKTS